MNIAVNTQHLIKDRLEGIGRFSYELLKRITKDHPEHRFYFIFDRPWDEEFIFGDNVIPLRTYLPSRHPFLWYLRFHFALPRLLRKYKIDLYYSPDGWGVSSPVPSVISLHDINFIHHPEQLPYWTSRYYHRYFPKYARSATALTTVSSFSRSDIAQQFQLREEKISIVPNAVSAGFKPISVQMRQEASQRWATGKKYFVFVGALNPRKNIGRLLQAFDAFSARQKDTHYHLVIIGQPMWATDQMKKAWSDMKFSSHVHFTGRLSEAELQQCMAAAEALLMPSLFEGFGIPVLEAMACDVPVITSNRTALPEIAGDAALLVDPESIEAISEALERISRHSALREDLIAKGRLRAQQYSWDSSAEKLWAVINRCLPEEKS